MERVAYGFAAALLVLLLASRATDAAPRNATTAPRKAFAPSSEKVDVAQPEEVAGALNEEEIGETRRGIIPWDDSSPDKPQRELRNWELALSMRKLRESWDTMTSQVMNHIYASVSDEQGSKIRAVLEKLNDPEIRKDLVRIAVGMAGITATGLLLGDMQYLREIGLETLYVAAFLYVVSTLVRLGPKLLSEASEQATVTRNDKTARQKLATLLGVRPENEGSPRRVDDQ